MLGVAFGAAVVALTYHISIASLAGPITFLDVYIWQLVSLFIWVILAPAVIRATLWLDSNGYRGWPLWAVMGLCGLAAFALHAVWVGVLAVTFSPYPTLTEFRSTVMFHLRFGLPVDLAVFGLLVALALRSAAHQELRKGEQRMIDLLRHLPGMAYRLKNDGRWSFEYASPGAEALTGWSWYELVKPGGPTLFQICVPEDVEAAYGEVAAALEQERPYQMYYRIRTRGGTVKWVFEQGRGIYDDDGRPVAVEGFISDVTQQKDAEQALVESERQFRSFFENAVFGVFRTTVDGKFLMVNRFAAEAIGYDSPEEAMAQVDDLATQVYADPTERARYLEAIRRDGFVTDWVWKGVRKDGSTLWSSETARGIFDEKGNLRFIEGTAKDITAEKRANEALIEAERRAAELRVQLANAQLRALKLQIKPHFLFNILNTVAMMIRGGDTAGAQQVVTMLGDMFRYFLDLEGEDTLSLERELEFLDLYLGLEQYRFADRMQVERDIDERALTCPVPTLLLQPIVENAVKHGVATISGRCRILFTARVEGGSLVVTVVNDLGKHGTAAADARRGIGIVNTRARLREMYGDAGSFELDIGNDRATAVLRIPLEGDKR